MSPIALELRSLCFSWPDGRVVLRDVTFSLHAGERVALVGANGAGKSTLLSLLVGLLRPEKGEVRVEGLKVEPGNLSRIRQVMGLLLQDPDDQLFLPSVEEDVAFGPQNLGLSHEEVRGRVSRALQRCGAEHLRDRPPYRLSAGEKRRVALAAVLALEARILALDEPTSHLDPRGRRELQELLTSLGLTTLLVTHDLDLAWDLAPRTLILRDGVIAADGPSEQLLSDEALLRSCGLELPLRRLLPRTAPVK